jgi:glutamate carboxypeptidase
MTVDDLVSDLADLVNCESPSDDLHGTAQCAALLAKQLQRRLNLDADIIDTDGRVHLRAGDPSPRVLLLGHLDTVWPLGTLARWPFTVDGDRATGPGVFDMKAGLVQLVAALDQLADLDDIGVLVTSDEEIGSTSAQTLIEETSRDASAVLVLEPSADGALKVARKGVGMFRLEVVGRAAHAGLEPHLGINATIEAAHQVIAAAALARPEAGTTVTPTVVTAGTTVNTVPASASVSIDVRATTTDEMKRVEQGLESLSPRLPGAAVKLVTRSVRLPLERTMSQALFERAQHLASALGLATLDGVEVGGGSDGNITAALGTPTLDGLGAVGGNAHAEGEWASVPAMTERAALVAGLLRDLLKENR